MQAMLKLTLPPGILDSVELDEPATTVELLKLNAVVGIQATVSDDNPCSDHAAPCMFFTS